MILVIIEYRSINITFNRTLLIAIMHLFANNVTLWVYSLAGKGLITHSVCLVRWKVYQCFPSNKHILGYRILRRLNCYVHVQIILM